MQGIQSAQNQYNCLPAAWSESVFEDKEGDKLPHDRAHLIAWIDEHEKRLKQLQELERRFIATRDVAYVKGFIFKGKHPTVELTENIEGPVAIIAVDNFLARGKSENFPAEQALREEKEIAKEFFPEITIKEVWSRSGERHLAYIGITNAQLEGAVSLRIAERSLARKIELARKWAEQDSSKRGESAAERTQDGKTGRSR